MTPDQIIQWAREAELAEPRDDASTLPADYVEALAKLCALSVAKEREDCAKVCESRYMGDNNREDMEARQCAAAIRARGEAV